MELGGLQTADASPSKKLYYRSDSCTRLRSRLGSGNGPSTPLTQEAGAGLSRTLESNEAPVSAVPSLSHFLQDAFNPRKRQKLAGSQSLAEPTHKRPHVNGQPPLSRSQLPESASKQQQQQQPQKSSLRAWAASHGSHANPVSTEPQLGLWRRQPASYIPHLYMPRPMLPLLEFGAQATAQSSQVVIWHLLSRGLLRLRSEFTSQETAQKRTRQHSRGAHQQNVSIPEISAAAEVGNGLQSPSAAGEQLAGAEDSLIGDAFAFIRALQIVAAERVTKQQARQSSTLLPGQGQDAGIVSCDSGKPHEEQLLTNSHKQDSQCEQLAEACANDAQVDMPLQKGIQSQPDDVVAAVSQGAVSVITLDTTLVTGDQINDTEPEEGESKLYCAVLPDHNPDPHCRDLSHDLTSQWECKSEIMLPYAELACLNVR